MYHKVFVAGFINNDHDKTGYWFSLVFVILGSCFLSLIHVDDGDAVLHTVPVVPHDSNNIMLDPEMSQRLNLRAFDDANNLSMSCNSKVDKFLVNGDFEGDLNGNLKFHRSDLHGMSPLSHSDPEGLNITGVLKNCDLISTPSSCTVIARSIHLEGARCF